MMKHSEDIDEQTLDAFVDEQLDPAQRSSVIQAMEHNPDVREQVYQLRRAKDLMKLGFEDARSASPGHRSRPTRRYAVGVAASLAMLGIGVSAGSLAYYYSAHLGAGTAVMASAPQTQRSHIVLHINDSDPVHFVAALNYVDKFLKENAGGRGEIEVVANAGGLELMRAGLSPYQQRVVDMINRHHNVHFIACANAIRNLQLQGIEPHIIKNVDTGQTALDHIVERLQSGWTYVKAESLPEA